MFRTQTKKNPDGHDIIYHLQILIKPNALLSWALEIFRRAINSLKSLQPKIGNNLVCEAIKTLNF